MKSPHIINSEMEPLITARKSTTGSSMIRYSVKSSIVFDIAQNQRPPQRTKTDSPSENARITFRRGGTAPPSYEFTIKTTSTSTSMSKNLIKVIVETYTNLYLRDNQLRAHLEAMGFSTRETHLALNDIDIKISTLTRHLKCLERILKLAARALDRQTHDFEYIAQHLDGLISITNPVIQLLCDAKCIASGLANSKHDPEHQRNLRKYWLERDFVPAVQELKHELCMLDTNVESACIIAERAYNALGSEIRSGIRGFLDTSGMDEYRPDFYFVHGINDSRGRF